MCQYVGLQKKKIENKEKECVSYILQLSCLRKLNNLPLISKR